jgi:hypothetical protein
MVEVKVYKVPKNFVFSIPKHIDNITIKIRENPNDEWRDAEVVKEVVESWGGYGKSCGGSRYLIRIKPKGGYTVAIGEYSYQACIPTEPSVKNYVYTDIKFLWKCDIMIEYDNKRIIFHVTDLREFEVNN